MVYYYGQLTTNAMIWFPSNESSPSLHASWEAHVLTDEIHAFIQSPLLCVTFKLSQAAFRAVLRHRTCGRHSDIHSYGQSKDLPDTASWFPLALVTCRTFNKRDCIVLFSASIEYLFRIIDLINVVSPLFAFPFSRSKKSAVGHFQTRLLVPTGNLKKSPFWIAHLLI